MLKVLEAERCAFASSTGWGCPTGAGRLSARGSTRAAGRASAAGAHHRPARGDALWEVAAAALLLLLLLLLLL